MKVKEIIALLKAGYTKEEIAEFKALESEEGKEPEEDPEDDPEDDPEEDPEEDPEPAAGIAELVNGLKEELVNGLKEMLQEHFRTSAEGKTPEAAAGEQVLKDILEKGVL